MHSGSAAEVRLVSFWRALVEEQTLAVAPELDQASLVEVAAVAVAEEELVLEPEGTLHL